MAWTCSGVLLRPDAELLERVLEERRLAAQTRHVHDGGGNRVDLRAGGGEVVLLVAAELEVRVGGLARLAEAHDRIAQLLHAAPAHVQEAHPQYDRGDLR